ncbi:BREX-1 system phosphatase PglZ type A [Clostridium perfringens]|uniref:BREX-1 system phosphatase PglZ type A n=1 Tax=Clostridium perfringens TaxID=1502 RepID=UPI0018E45F47|nr:BREX-1 system phosphatase PglZ type A [Clostridium perfringens]MBI6002169.1 BREX-1 system phosphatase PglZ type A [Clostridium perfringens]MBI6064288.1 BREX-1 system phosphatase PglZ type A [Clostridium perfringens]MBI6076934.1 BREX-1 system phosphatase PglZ type A [Clostridium perfringens]MBI6104567.1 BREX-1 system phosphatase PglZ type A [Clostridium perfringens]MDM0990551.1 BREX-1 system phosphatase PglZ type A [Clostridium perfringens]
MNLKEIKNFLNDIFSKPLGDGKVRHIVFWYDENEDFTEEIDEFDLEGVELIKLNDNNAFYTKYHIEKENVDGNILVYSNMKKPKPQEDWLYDILSYSEEFSTDRATVIMRELKVNNPYLKEAFTFYNTFFKNKDRLAAFRNLGIQDYTEEKVHIGVLAVLTKTKIMNFEEITRALIKEKLDGNSKLYEEIDKFGSLDILWNLISKNYGYSFEERSLEKFMAVLLITNMNETIKFNLPKQYEDLVSKKSTDCIVFINHFMNSLKDSHYYDKMQGLIGEKLKISKLLEKTDSDKFLKCDVFEEMDKLILGRIINLLNDGIEEYDKYLNLMASRRTLHYYKKYESEYKALKWAIRLLSKKKELNSIIKTESSYEMVKSYARNYFEIDKAYRKFYYHFDNCELKEILNNLKDTVENLYNNWYLQELSIKWNEALAKQKTWQIEGVNQQERFYNDNIKYGRKERVFVIISDALRYESAEELSTRLRNERKAKVELDYMQGVLPSYTKLGMAALLPNKKIEINSNYDVLVDGINSNGTENRDKILKVENDKSLAITYNKLMDLKEAEFRKVFSGLEVVYIYHNTIDAIGDHASTEREVFSATDTALNELINLVNKLVHRVSASSIIITSDHGYLYKRSHIEEYDKISGVKLEDGEDNRRFLLTYKDKDIEGTMKFSMDYLLGEDSGMNVVTPKGIARFKVQGAGANYVHGGAMLQEILVPIIKFKNDRSSSSENDIRKVKISLTSITRKITNIITYLEFFQDEKIQDKVITQRIKCYFEDEEGNRISNENTIIGDSKSENPIERSYREKFVLKSIPYDKRKQYYLVIEDEDDSSLQCEKIPFNIDIAIVDDFGF